MLTEERVDRLETALASFMEKSEEVMEDLRASMADVRASVAEIRASNARTDAQLLEMRRVADRNQERADRDRERAEQDRKDFNRRLAELSDSMGTLIEDMVAPNAARIVARIFPDNPPLMLAQRIRRRHSEDPSRMIELDLVAAGKGYLVVFEAKRRVNPDKIREFVDRISVIRDYFPEHAASRVVPVIASVNIESSVIAYLNRQKVYGVAMGDETMDLVNLGGFEI